MNGGTTRRVRDLKDLTADEEKEFTAKYDIFVFDIDGTLCGLTSGPLPGVKDAISALHSSGKEMLILTDNCLQSRERAFRKLHSIFPEFKQENFYTCAWILVEHMKKIGVKGKIYVVGAEAGIIEDLKNAGYEVVYDKCEEITTLERFLTLDLEEGVTAVVLGMDLNYSVFKIAKAVNHLLNPSVHFFVTHILAFGQKDKLRLPVCGSLVLPIQACSGREPVFSGKGSQMVVDYIHSLGYDMKRCLFVGDMFVSDMVCGNTCGMDTLLVTSGSWNHCTLEDVLNGDDPLLVPTYCAESIADLGRLYSRNS